MESLVMYLPPKRYPRDSTSCPFPSLAMVGKAIHITVGIRKSSLPYFLHQTHITSYHVFHPQDIPTTSFPAEPICPGRLGFSWLYSTLPPENCQHNPYILALFCRKAEMDNEIPLPRWANGIFICKLKNTPTPNPINTPQCLTCGNPIQDYRLAMVKTLPPTPKSSPSNYTKPVPIKIFYPISTSFPRKANPYFRIFSFGIPFARSAVS